MIQESKYQTHGFEFQTNQRIWRSRIRNEAKKNSY